MPQSLLRVFAERCCLYNNSKISTSDETVKKDLKSLSVKNFPREHKTWFNKKKVIRMLNKAGFENVYESAYCQSKSPLLLDTNLFDNTQPELSLYVEAIK